MTRLVVLGQPAPQGSKSAIVRNGKAHLIEGRGSEGRRRFSDWRHAVRAEAQRHIEATGHTPLDGPVTCSLFFGLPRPASAPKRRRTWPKVKPDIDKLARTVLDAITGSLVTDDARIVHLEVSKDYCAHTGVVIDLAELSDTDLYETPAELGALDVPALT